MHRLFGIYNSSVCFSNNKKLQEELDSFYKITHNQFHIFYKNDTSSQIGSNQQVYEDTQFISVLIGRLVIENESDAQVVHHSSISSLKWKNIIERIISDIDSKELIVKGEFILMIYEKRIDRIVIIGDQFGFRPFYFLLRSDYFAFASDIALLTLLYNEELEIDARWIADSISTVRSESHLTPYSNISKLNPASVLEYRVKLTTWRYWSLDLNDSYKDLSFEESCILFRSKLLAAIENRLLSSKRIGSELSGGLDSSGVTALAYIYTQEQKKPFYTFSHVLSESRIGKDYPYSDERQFSALLTKHIKHDNHIYCDAEEYGIIQALNDSIRNHSGPTQLAYDIFSDVIYNKAKINDIDTLLSGFGGDEGVSNSANIFFKELIDSNNREKYIKEFTLKWGKRFSGKSRAFLSFYFLKYSPYTRSFINDILRRKVDWRAVKFDSFAIDEGFCREMSIKDRFFEQKAIQSFRDVRSGQMNRIVSNHIPQRLEYSYFSAKAMGIDYVYPLLDVDLLELYYSLPTEYKFRNGQGRALFREVIKDVVPDSLRLRKDKSLHTIPVVNQRICNDYKRIKALIILSKRRNNYHYLDYEKMLQWLDRICDHTFNDRNPDSPQAFINSLQILLLQELERNGEFKSGIKV